MKQKLIQTIIVVLLFCVIILISVKIEDESYSAGYTEGYAVAKRECNVELFLHGIKPRK